MASSRVSRISLCLFLGSTLAVPAVAAEGADEAEQEQLIFTHVLDGAELDVYTPLPDEEFTPEVEEFHVTGENPYTGDEQAIEDGAQLYRQWCQACHMPDGSGRMGPALNDDRFRHEEAATDKGEFEIIYGGAAGAMQAFGDRIEQDGILRLMAFTETLRRD